MHFIEKQAYKLKLLKKWRIYDVFHMLLLEQNTTKKRQVYENVTELNTGNENSREYKIEAICNSTVYARELAGHLPEFYYLVF